MRSIKAVLIRHDMTCGHGSLGVLEDFMLHFALGREVGDGPQLFRATWGLWLYASRKSGGQSRKWTEELTSLAQTDYTLS